MMIPRRIQLAGFGLLLLTILGTGAWFSLAPAPQQNPPAAASPLPPAIQRHMATYTSGGQAIRAEAFSLPGPAKRPLVIILHGSGGTSESPDGYHLTAQALAKRGYLAVVLHYFDRTGTRIADEKLIRANFLTWMQTVADGLAFAAELPNADPQRIGLLGFSLGGYLSLSLAAQNDRVAAVVEYFGGLPDLLLPLVRRMPPTLVLHGELDRVVPIGEARKLQQLYAQRQFPLEARIYPDQGHGFTGEAARDAAAHTLAFFERYLKAPANP